MSFTITKLTAIVAVDEDGEEGIMGALLNGQWHPMIAADERRLLAILPHAIQIANLSGKPYRILEFSSRCDVTEKIKEQYKI